jgi:hypothetical protein
LEARSLITSAIVNADDLVKYDLWVPSSLSQHQIDSLLFRLTPSV